MHPAKLHVVTVVSNPLRYRSRIELYNRFQKRVVDAGAKLYTVEVAFGDRDYTVTESNNPQHVQLRTIDEIWNKEQAINIGISKLPADWEYVAWIDSDVNFAHPTWAAEAVHQLQHYEVIQMWSTAQDLRLDFTPYQTHQSFVWSHLAGRERAMQAYEYWWHPGFAWAATRKAINTMGGLFDVGILGAGDNHMAHSLFGWAKDSIPDGVHRNYAAAVLQWQDRANALHQDVGYMPGLILHDFHGAKKKRGYYSRWQILVDHQFDPQNDLIKDWQGLWQIKPERVELRNALRAYFRSRDEDGTDL